MKHHQIADILLAAAQGRQGDVHRLQAKEQVVPEPSGPDFVFQVLVGGGDDPEIAALLPVFPHRSKALLLQDAQEHPLDVEWHLPDLVEKQGAAIGQLDQPRAIPVAPVNAPRR